MTTNEKKLLELSKKMFFHFTGQTLEMAKELLLIEEELMIGEKPPMNTHTNTKEEIKGTPIIPTMGHEEEEAPF